MQNVHANYDILYFGLLFSFIWKETKNLVSQESRLVLVSYQGKGFTPFTKYGKNILASVVTSNCGSLDL